MPFEMASFLSVLEMEEEKASQGGREVTVAVSHFRHFPLTIFKSNISFYMQRARQVTGHFFFKGKVV